MKIDKSQILEMLTSQGQGDRAEQAGNELPDQVDTDNAEHKNVLSKFGIDPADLIGKVTGKLPGGLGDKLGSL